MKIIVLFFLIIIVTSGCHKQHPDVIIYNETENYFDSVHVQATQGRITSFKKIEPYSKYKSKIFFDSLMISDGGYLLNLFIDADTLMSRSFGYYTNGESMNSAFLIRIKNDTIEVESK